MHEPDMRVTLRQMLTVATLLASGKLLRTSGNLSRNLGSPTKVSGRKVLRGRKMNAGKSIKKARIPRRTKGDRESVGLALSSSYHAEVLLSKLVDMVTIANTPISVLRLYLTMITSNLLVWRVRRLTSRISSSYGVCPNLTGSPWSINVSYQTLMTLKRVVKEELRGRSTAPSAPDLTQITFLRLAGIKLLLPPLWRLPPSLLLVHLPRLSEWQLVW